MILFKKADALTKYLETIIQSGMPIGFVPTMGALHQGHLQLVETCRRQSGLTVASIFVNPTQFNDPQDFDRYPVTLENDIRLLEQAGCDILFLPSVIEIYPAGTANLPHFALGELETIWEGKYRPGHFQGVCQVMNRLLGIVMPARLFMGRKDYQQCMVIKQLIRLNNWPIDLVMAPTVREPSGLAMSSRNMRLNETQKAKAVAIYDALQYLSAQIQSGDIPGLIRHATRMLTDAGFEKVDYVAIADAETLAAVDHPKAQQPLVALVAAFIGGVRLIDNRTLA